MAIERESRPRVLVVGAGAVGSLLGGVLSARGCNVTLLSRSRTGAAISGHGLHICCRTYAGTVYPDVVNDPEMLRRPPDVILLAVKAYDAISALKALPQSILERSPVVSLQNGVGTEEAIVGRFPDVNLVAGSLTVSASRDERGGIRSTSGSGGIGLAPVSNRAVLEPIAGILRKTGFPVRTFGDYRSMKWSKLLLNLMGNATSAIMGRSPERVYADRRLYALELGILREALAVMRAQRLSPVWLPGYPVQLLEWGLRMPESVSRPVLTSLVSSGRGGQMPSLYRDIEANRIQTEAPWLYGEVVRAGAATRVPVPVNRRISRIVAAIAANHRLRSSFRAAPDLLLRNAQLGRPG